MDGSRFEIMCYLQQVEIEIYDRKQKQTKANNISIQLEGDVKLINGRQQSVAATWRKDQT